jgi:hypothetical protein
MIGDTFWDDMGIDAYEKQVEIEQMAHVLVDHWGKSLTEKDLLKLNAYSNCNDNPIEAAFARAALEYYKQQDFDPEFIHADMCSQTNSKRWWQIWKYND